MPVTRPCGHCKGSGSEPSPLTLAADRLEAALGDVRMADVRGTLDLRQAVNDYGDALKGRITALEAALAGALGGCEPRTFPASADQVIHVMDRADYDSYQAILDGTA